MNNKNIYQMKLHEFIWMSSINAGVIRVPGGWIYKTYIPEVGIAQCFVPMNKEFTGTDYDTIQ